MTKRGREACVFLRYDWLAGCLVLLGIALRTVQYGRGPAMWHDEAALVVNVLQKSFLQLLGPLKYAEAAPPLFLWVEKAVVLGLGDGTYALRLLPYLAGCATVVFAWFAARRALDPQAGVWAVLLVACSDRLLWHSCEAKPYALDAMVSLGILSLYLISRSWTVNRRILVFSALSPAVVWISYPGCFLYGAVLLVLLPQVWQSRKSSTWGSYVWLCLSVAVSFLVLYFGPISAQRHASMDSCWVHAFPDWTRPWLWPWWFAVSTVEVVDYGLRPIGGALTGVALVGAVHLWRAGRRDLIVLLVTPILLAAVAGLLHAYPYTGARVMVFAQPGIAFLTAAGVYPVFTWLNTWGNLGEPWLVLARRVAGAALLIVLLTPMVWSLYRAVVPWPRADTAAASAYVLAERRDTDPVIANHWEYDYYFRHLGTGYHPLEGEDSQELSGERVWLVVTGHEARQRSEIVQGFLRQRWSVAERREFFRTTVVLLVRTGLTQEDVQRRSCSESGRMGRSASASRG